MPVHYLFQVKKKTEKKIHKNLMEKEASDASSDTNDGHHQPALPSKLVGLFSKPAGVNLKKDGKKVKVLASFVFFLLSESKPCCEEVDSPWNCRS